MLSRKGGNGKTTLAVHLAVLAQEAGRRTLLVDLDPQHLAADWWRAREAETPLLVETSPTGLRDVLETGATGTPKAATARRASPVSEASPAPRGGPAILDLRAILGTIDVIKGAIRRSRIVLNACPDVRLRVADRADGGRSGAGRQGGERDARAVARGGKGAEP